MKKTVYYTNPVTDDFAENITKHYQIKDDFKFIHKNIFYRFFSFVLYHIIAIPIFYCILKIKYHVRVYNKSNLKKLKNTGYFVYMNHTQNIIDAFINQVFLSKRKGFIVADNDVYSLKGLNTIVSMLGTLPTPNNMIQSKNFFDAVSYYVKDHNKLVVIMPEAHIWPYYNDIRPFLDTSFIFPSILNKPIVTTTVVYRERKILKNKHPYISLYIGDPIYPKIGITVKENQTYLRDLAYKQMKDNVIKYKSFEYIKYALKEQSEKK